MKTLKLLCFCALYLLVQSCSKKENSLIPNSSNLNSKKAAQWSLGQPLVNGVYWFKNANGQGFQVGTASDGAPIQQNTYIGYPNQQWQVTYLGSGKYSIINNWSGKSIDIPSSVPSNPPTTQNLQLQQWDYNGTNNQIWNIPFIYYGTYEIKNNTNGLAVTLYNNLNTQFDPIVQTTYVADAAHVWVPTAIPTVDSATVNFGSTTGTMNHVAAGFLHGFTASGSTMVPPDSLITPLKINAVREREDDSPSDFSVIAPALEAKGYKQEINISDSWQQPYGSGPAPGYGGNWAAWDTTVRNVVNQGRSLITNGSLEWDIWNEPNGGFWKYTGTYAFPAWYYETWKHAYQAIRQIDPNAIITGPCFDDNDLTGIEAFLSYCKTNNVVPNYVTWHFSKNISSEISTLNTYISQNGITGVSGYQINEYITSSEQYAGKNAWWIAQLDRAKVNAAMHAIWGSTQVGQLDGVVGTQAQSFQKLATWWVYKAYGDITGTTLTTTPGVKVDIVAGHAASPNSVNMLVGTQSGLATGVIEVICNNVSSVFSGRATLKVTLKQISNASGGFVTNIAPFYIENAPVVNNTVRIFIPCYSDQDAYEVNVQ